MRPNWLTLSFYSSVKESEDTGIFSSKRYAHRVLASRDCTNTDGCCFR